MNSSHGGYSDAVATGSRTLANDTDGTIQATVSSGGERIITGTPVNHGSIDFDSEAHLSIAGTLFNSGQIGVDSSDYTDQSDLPSTGFLHQGIAGESA